jgi:hypothetical protein
LEAMTELAHRLDPTTRVCTACGVPEQFINTKDCNYAAEKALLTKLKAHQSPTLDDLERLDRAEVKAIMAAMGRYTVRATVADMPRFKARQQAAKQGARTRNLNEFSR